jgi:cellulose synthase/poly-beta-1,6-N-acetylglucosamine synthase-like glycosyltransferase
VTFVAYIFWACFVLVVYVYVLYPLVLFVSYSIAQIARDWRYLSSRQDRRVRAMKEEELPAVALIVPAYNEERCLPEKRANIRAINYPPAKMEVIFVSDGSTDRTNEILSSFDDSNVQSLFLSERKGKFNALNCGVSQSHTEFLIFSDASTLFAPDAIQKLIRHFANSEVGAVCGSVQLVGSAESQRTEGVYWKYESMLHLMEGRLGATVTASGAIYALRRRCYRPLEPGDVIDDFLIPMNARKMGYRVLYDPEATATEFSVDSVKGEFSRRVRLAVGSFRALSRIASLPLSNFAGLALISHKLLRWILPFLLIGLFVSSLFLLNRPFYRITFLCQLAFYLWAVLGFFLHHRMQRVRYALVGYFLVSMYAAFLVGFWRYRWGQTDSTWQKVS